eukprot:gnl/TRDRNA2_/TRDRNA2_177572_c1_seq5.p1 gnl/TRDRNA2_/TRDRNA2_177572_c1~~gnl/TRDRNA2_/TRDRNA2_177572_c1_seq5.p1  ORF type:complete len:142 (+),score=21.39 gnl/TRDRNA2_/TRDRNA2_177572_c1_seq5:139-564(+)
MKAVKRAIQILELNLFYNPYNHELVFDSQTVSNSAVLSAFLRHDESKEMLRSAAGDGQAEAERLMWCRASVNHEGAEGQTPLRIAPQEEHLGSSTFYIASQEGQLEDVKFLCEARAAKDQMTHLCASPLYIASQEGHLEHI